jgi:ABC-type transport system involved in multi-copper enzyme maturation permease subunit
METGQLMDYSDRLPAVAVREWRQGLRSRVFVGPFMALQGGLFLLTTFQLNEPRSAGVAGMYWLTVLTVLVVVLPLRSLGALSEEREGSTMDVLVLTNLDGWSIVSGKWLATASMILLAAVSVLPTILLRWLVGGWSPLDGLAGLGAAVLMGWGMAGLLTLISWLRPTLLRMAVAVILLLWVFVWGVVGLCAELASGNVASVAMGMGLGEIVWPRITVLLAAGWCGLLAAAYPLSVGLPVNPRLRQWVVLGWGLLSSVGLLWSDQKELWMGLVLPCAAVVGVAGLVTMGNSRNGDAAASRVVSWSTGWAMIPVGLSLGWVLRENSLLQEALIAMLQVVGFGIALIVRGRPRRQPASA